MTVGLTFRLVLEFPIALPDYPTILAVGVPDFGAVHTTAVAADDLPGKGSKPPTPGPS